MPSTFFINLAGSTFLWWLAVYLLSRNTRSKIAWISASFLACLSIYILANNVSRQLTVYDYYTWLWHLTDWSYILPIALIFHFSVVVTGKEKQRANKILTILMYLAAAMLIYLSTSTELLVSNDIKDFVPGIGYLNPRGPFFWLIAPFVAFASIGAIYTYVRALKEQSHLDHQKKVKYLLAVISSSLYLIVGPVIVLLYYAPIESLAVQWSPVLISLPFIPMLVAILFYRLVSDVDYIFNWKEFSYLTLTIFLLSALNASIFIIFIAPHIGELAYIFAAVFSFITI